MAKTLLQIIKQITGEEKLPVPLVVLASDDQTVVHLTSLTVAAMDDLMNEFDWQQMVRPYTFTTVAGTDTYTLPTDYLRAIKQTFWQNAQNRPMNGSINPEGWGFLNHSPNGSVNAQFRIVGNRIQVYPMPAAAITYSFQYIASSCIWDPTIQNYKSDFSLDSDQPAFNSRCLTNFVKYKYMQIMGFDTQAALEDFSQSLMIAKGADVPAPILSAVPAGSMKMIGLDNLPDFRS
ncbi:hypothetical protein [Variovorax sp. LG9.2]|uniref:phage adaptor protein n=1 Tax=Variovorax sp. LG9.2 TaxID=3048626 RepID=UPI002B226A14|nr:hypothetical protein [Variovorax sp. LG9.2]MEB0057313.1 hypothetical protein [Variovorax sp. LG9.2]